MLSVKLHCRISNHVTHEIHTEPTRQFRMSHFVDQMQENLSDFSLKYKKYKTKNSCRRCREYLRRQLWWMVVATLWAGNCS